MKIEGPLGRVSLNPDRDTPLQTKGGWKFPALNPMLTIQQTERKRKMSKPTANELMEEGEPESKNHSEPLNRRVDQVL